MSTFSGLGAFAGGMAGGMKLGQMLREKWDKDEAGKIAKAAMVQTDNGQDFADFHSAADGAAALGGKTDWNAETGQYDIKDSDGATLQSFKPEGMKYTAGGQTQDKPFTESQRRGFGLRAQADYWAGKGDADKADALYERIEQMGERDFQRSERQYALDKRAKQDAFEAGLGKMQQSYAEGEAAIQRGEFDHPALQPMLQSFNTQGSGWQDDGRTAKIEKGTNGWQAVFTDADGKTLQAEPISAKNALGAWRDFKHNELSNYYRQQQPLEAYKSDMAIAGETRKEQRAISADERKAELERIRQDGQERRLLATLGAKFGGKGGSGSRGGSGGGGDSSLPPGFKDEKQFADVMDAHNTPAPAGADAGRFATEFPAIARQLMISNPGMTAPAAKHLATLAAADLTTPADPERQPQTQVGFSADPNGNWTRHVTVDGKTYALGKISEAEARAGMQRASGPNGKVDEKPFVEARMNAAAIQAEKAQKIRSDPKAYAELAKRLGSEAAADAQLNADIEGYTKLQDEFIALNPASEGDKRRSPGQAAALAARQKPKGYGLGVNAKSSLSSSAASGMAWGVPPKPEFKPFDWAGDRDVAGAQWRNLYGAQAYQATP